MAFTRIYSPPIVLRAIILILLSGFNSGLAQTGLVSPVVGPALPSGSFGELRGNHFHSGIDYKTGGIEGLPVRAADEGFVSRIKVSPGGYGLALYITHPNGVTTVYGHLSGFYDAVADTVQQSQYLRKKFDTEIFPAPGRFAIKRGQIIGFSGNTGSSKGPHLHFETRHSHSEKPYNPHFSGVGYADTIPPAIHAVYLYQPGPFGWLHGSSSSAASGSESNSVSDRFFVGIEYSDKANGSDSRLGVSGIQILMNGSVACAMNIDSFSFDLTSQIKAMSDPKRPGSLVCLKLPGNTLPFFVTGNGLISLPKGSEGLLEVRITDPSGNTSSRQFQLKSEISSSAPAKVIPNPFVSSDQLFEPIAVDVSFEGKKMRKKLNIRPSDAIFKSQVSFRFEKLKKLKADPFKLVGLRLDQSGSRTTVPVTVLDGVVYIKSQTGGTYGIDTDTSSPVAGMLYFKGYDFRGNLIYECPFSDDLSGLQESEAQINGTWALSGHHTNRDVIFLIIDPAVPLTDATVSLSLTDRCGNLSVTTYKIQNQTEITRQ